MEPVAGVRAEVGADPVTESVVQADADGGQQQSAHGAIPVDPIRSTAYGQRSICTICDEPCYRTSESGGWTHNRMRRRTRAY